jgi:hypothetical protein
MTGIPRQYPGKRSEENQAPDAAKKAHLPFNKEAGDPRARTAVALVG